MQVKSEDQVEFYQTTVYRHDEGDYCSSSSNVQIQTKDRDRAKEVHNEIVNKLKEGKSIYDVLKFVASDSRFKDLSLTYNIERTESESMGLAKKSFPRVLAATKAVKNLFSPVKTISAREAVEKLKVIDNPEIGKTYEFHFSVDLDAVDSNFEKDYPGVVLFPYLDLITTNLREDASLSTQAIRYGLDGDSDNALLKPKDVNAYEISFLGKESNIRLTILSGKRKLAREIHDVILEKINSFQSEGEAFNWLLNESPYSKRMGERNSFFRQQPLISYSYSK